VAGAIFVLAGSSTREQGPVAALVSTAGWAAAAERVLGRSWVVTPAGVLSPAQARRRGSDRALRSPGGRRLRRGLPTVAKTAIKDVHNWGRRRRFVVDPAGPWRATDVRFVWQRHELFHTAGLSLARRLGVPSVLFMPAPLVWEAEQWGTTRPGWGRWVERLGECPSLLGTDLVACGSEEVAEQARRLGVPDERMLLTPTGVDLDEFAQTPDPGPLRRRLGLEGRFVVGWVGSFRRFHAVEQAVEAAAAVADTSLLLVGDGPERARIERLAYDVGVPAAFTGTVPHDELPAYLAAMDAAVILARGDAPFHYSPLKLAEYLAAGLPVVAPAVRGLANRLTDGVDAVVVPKDDAPALSAALRRLRDDPGERVRLGKGARASAEAEWSWDRQVSRLAEALAIDSGSEPPQERAQEPGESGSRSSRWTGERRTSRRVHVGSDPFVVDP
jgi:glycosyltransferase involved in cell wall biosynthesis